MVDQDSHFRPGQPQPNGQHNPIYGELGVSPDDNLSPAEETELARLDAELLSRIEPHPAIGERIKRNVLRRLREDNTSAGEERGSTQ